MSRGIEILLGEILDAIDLLQDYTEGLGFDQFAANVEKQDSVMRRLVTAVIVAIPGDWCEAARRV